MAPPEQVPRRKGRLGSHRSFSCSCSCACACACATSSPAHLRQHRNDPHEQGFALADLFSTSSPGDQAHVEQRSALHRRSPRHRVVASAVGDRWLARALRDVQHDGHRCSLQLVSDLAVTTPQRRQKAKRHGQEGDAAAIHVQILGMTRQDGTTQRKEVRNQRGKSQDHEAEEALQMARSRERCLLTNPTSGRGATLRAAGIERCASLVMTRTGGRASRVWAKAASDAESWLKTATDSGGVMAAARRDGSYRNWRSPPGPGEKDPGAR